MYETTEITKENVLSELLEGSALDPRKCRKSCNPDGFHYKRLSGRNHRQGSQKEGEQAENTLQELFPKKFSAYSAVEYFDNTGIRMGRLL